MCSSTSVDFWWMFFLLFSPMHRQSKQWPEVVQGDKLTVPLLLTLPGKRSWLLPLPLRRGMVWWDKGWWAGREALPQDMQLPSCLMSLSSNRSSNPCFRGLPLALLRSASFKTQSLSDPLHKSCVFSTWQNSPYTDVFSENSPLWKKKIKISCPKL